MGTWGTKIFQNDDASDLRDAYRERLILGASDDDAEQATIKEFSAGNSFSLWLPLAVAQWEVGRLSDIVRENALFEIEKELCSLDELWKPEYIPKRRKELTDAKAQICSQKPARKKLRMPGWAWKCPWPTGSVLQFRIKYPKEDNPLLDEYVMLQVLGISDTPPDKIPCEVISVGLYLWHGTLPPTEQINEIEANPPALSGFLTRAGTVKTAWCIMPQAGFEENEIKCIRKSPFVTSGIEPIRGNAASNAMFQEAVCRTLLSSKPLYP